MDWFELMTRRRVGSGLLLLVFVLVMLAYPLWRTRGIDHPLSAQLQLDLCAKLPPPPAALPGPLHGVGAGANVGISCELRGLDEKTVMTVFLTTTRTASVSGPQRTSTIYETWVKEVKASGAQDMRDEKGPWATAQSYRYGGNQQMLIEDHGVMLFLSSDKLEADALARYARDTATVLRGP